MTAFVDWHPRLSSESHAIGLNFFGRAKRNGLPITHRLINGDDITTTWGIHGPTSPREDPHSEIVRGSSLHWRRASCLGNENFTITVRETIPCMTTLLLSSSQFRNPHPRGGDEISAVTWPLRLGIDTKSRLITVWCYFHFIIADLGTPLRRTTFPCDRRQALPRSFRNVPSTPIAFLKSESLN